MNYVDELEKQNEELKQKLARCEPFAPFWLQQSGNLHYYLSERGIYARIIIKYTRIAAAIEKNTFEVEYHFNEFRKVAHRYSTGVIEFDGKDYSVVTPYLDDAKECVEKSIANGEYGKLWITAKDQR